MSPPLENKDFPDPPPAAEGRFREMVEFLPVIVYETDGEGRLTFANRHAFSFFGYTAEGYQKGLNVLDMIAPEDRERAGGNFRKNLQGEKTGEAEYQIVKKDGSPFRGLIASAPILKKGRPVGLRGVVTDISRLRNVEEGLKESEEKFRLLVELSDDGVAWTRGDRHIFANRRMAEIFGYPGPEAIQQRTVLDLVHPDERERVRRIHADRLQDKGAPKRYEYKGIRQDGETVFIEVSAIRAFYQGEWGSLAFLRDITERRRAEKELQESRELYQTLVEMSNDAVTLVRGDFHEYVNPKMVEIFGYERADEIVGHSLLKMIHPDDRQRVQEINRQRQQGDPVPEKYVFKGIRKDGRPIYLETSAKRLQYQGESVSLVFLRDISERVQADRALRESEARARLIFDTVPDSITITRVADGRYLQVNEYFCQLTGYSREETVGRTVADLKVFVNGQDRERFIRELRERGEVNEYEIQYRKKDGSLFTTLLSARPIHYGGEDCLVAVVTDITKRKTIEDALRQSEEKHRKLVEAMREGFGVLNERNEITYINRRFCDLMGYRPEEMVGRPVTDFVDRENLQTLQEQGIRRRKGEKGPYEIAWTRKDGQPVYSLMSPEPVFDEQGHYKGSFAVITDISDRKQMEEALRKSEERYRLLVDNANEAILVIQEGLIRFVNPKAVKIMHMDGVALAPRPFWEFIHPEDRDMVLQRYQERLAGKELPKTYSFRLLDLEGRTIWVEINAVQIIWEGRPAALVFLTDITEKKQLEMQFLQAQKMEAIGRLAGGVAHDFNNLLTSIVGHADLMLLELRPEDPLVGDIREIKKAADRAADLTRQLLAFSRKQILQPRIVNLNQVIADMKKMLRRLIGEDVELETNLAPDPGLVLVDPGQIDQVVMNLVVNARDALPRGGKLTISTARAEITAADVPRYIGSKPGSYVLLEVRDNGLGMSEEVQSHVFEPFFTTKELGKGTGLGLSTVYGIVKQSNGYIWVESEPGVGTAFKIFLPRLEGQAVAESRPEKAASSCRGTETILLVEDNDLVRRLARSVLEQFGYRVLEARNGEEACRLGRGYEGRIDLLLTDVVMPGMSGQTLAGQIREMRPETEVLFMSGYSEESTLNQGTLRGGRHFLQKPFSPQELGQRVRKLLDESGG